LPESLAIDKSLHAPSRFLFQALEAARLTQHRGELIAITARTPRA
jgi:hypothetical protein